jgi:phosphatidylethanolamine-binding protein (PEBP) family uncharacterized protein
MVLPLRWPTVRTWLVILIVILAGCANDGRTLADPLPDQTTTTRPPPPTSAPDSEESESGLTLSSPDFQPGDQAPLDTTCEGRNIFPALEWTEVDPAAAELALALIDQTEPEEPLLLWLMAGISPQEQGVAAGRLPEGAYQTLNDYGSQGWGSPCLESSGDGERDLQFRLYVLNEPSGLVEGAPGNEAWDTVAARSIDTASILMRITASST